MVNITVLSEDILKRLCIVVSAKSIKHFYQQNPSEFSKIKPGYRPNMISDEELAMSTGQDHDHEAEATATADEHDHGKL